MWPTCDTNSIPFYNWLHLTTWSSASNGPPCALFEYINKLLNLILRRPWTQVNMTLSLSFFVVVMWCFTEVQPLVIKHFKPLQTPSVSNLGWRPFRVLFSNLVCLWLSWTGLTRACLTIADMGEPFVTNIVQSEGWMLQKPSKTFVGKNKFFKNLWKSWFQDLKVKFWRFFQKNKFWGGNLISEGCMLHKPSKPLFQKFVS